MIREHLPAGPEMHFDDRLRELSLGSWDGLAYQEIAMRCPGVFDGDGRYEWYFRSPDGEHYDAFANRLSGWLRDWTGHGVLVVVTHGIVTRVLRGMYAGLTREVALMLPVSQDKVYRLAEGLIEQLPVPVPAIADRDQTFCGATGKDPSR